MSYVRVIEEDGETPVELPAEDDDTLPVSTLQAQFPQAVGLKYLPDPQADVFRGIRCIDGKLKPPKEGWDDITFYCVYPPDYKRKTDDELDGPAKKKPCGPREVKCSDLIVLGLNFATTDESLKKYFEEKFGPLLMALVKTDLHTKRSKGFGFIRFSKYEDQVKALSARKHEIDGRWVTIKPPYAKEGVESSLPSKVFISRLTPSMLKEDLSEYFGKYGEVADVFFPQTPFRGFAFLTFVSPDAADKACDEEPHIIKNISVSVVHATDQQKKPSGYGNFRDGGRSGGYGGGRGGGGYGGYKSYGSGPRDRGYGSSRYGRSSYNGNSMRDNYRDDYDNYDRRGGGNNYNNYGNGGEDIGKILAAALNNPNTVSNLLNNLANNKSGPPSGGGSSRNMDYASRDYNSSADYKDYSYSEQKYNPYPDDKGYGSSGKYSGGNSSRY